MAGRNLTLLTDLYELTMMQGYFKEKDANETVIFDAFYRSNPCNNGYSICAGLAQEKRRHPLKTGQLQRQEQETDENPRPKPGAQINRKAGGNEHGKTA